MGAYAANENLNLPTDNQRLRDVIADVSEAANKARNDLCRVAKVSSGSLGSVKDVFDEMMRDMTAKVTDLSKDQVAEERRKARDELQNQSAEQQARFERQMQDAVDAVTSDRDARVGAAEESAKNMRTEFEQLKYRSESSEELLKKGEEALRTCEAELVKTKGKMADASALDQLSRDKWNDSVNDLLASCTIVAKREEKVADPSKPWRAKQPTAAEQVRKMLDRMPTPRPELFYAEQLKIIIGYYEDAKISAERDREEEKHLAEEALEQTKEAAKIAAASVEEERQQEREQAKQSLSEFREDHEKRKKLEKEINTVHKDAQEKAAVDVNKAKSEAAAAAAELQAAQSQLADANRQVRQMAEAHAAAKEQFLVDKTTLHMLLKSERRRLADALAAGTHGGYFFSAARTSTSPTMRSRPSSPLLSTVLSAAEAASPGHAAAFSPAAAAAEQASSPPPRAGGAAAPPSISPVASRRRLGAGPSQPALETRPISAVSAAGPAAAGMTPAASPPSSAGSAGCGSPESPTVVRVPLGTERRSGGRKTVQRRLKLNLNHSKSETGSSPPRAGRSSHRPSNRSSSTQASRNS